MVIGSNAVPAAITQVDARTGCKFTAPEAFLIYAEYFIYIVRHAGQRAPLRVPHYCGSIYRGALVPVPAGVCAGLGSGAAATGKSLPCSGSY